MVEPISLTTAALISGGLQALGSTAGGYMQGRSAEKVAKRQHQMQREALKETKLQRTRRHLVDEVLRSLSGEGKYSELFKPNYDNADLFDPSSEAFQKSFVQPALSKFKNQIAPAIQQQYVGTGQEGSSSLNDTLLRAGVDLDSMLNKYMYSFQENAKNRRQNAYEGALNRQGSAISNIFGLPAGAPHTPSYQGATGGDIFSSAVGGTISSPEFAKNISNVLDAYTKQQGNTSTAPPTMPNYYPPRTGFKPEPVKPFNINSRTGG